MRETKGRQYTHVQVIAKCWPIFNKFFTGTLRWLGIKCAIQLSVKILLHLLLFT